MKFAVLGARIILGLIFFVFGLNGFLNFLPSPEMTAESGAFLGALAASGYMFPLIKAIEVVAGALLLGGVLVPFALTILAPITINIIAFHLAMEPAGMPIAIAVLVLNVFLAWAYRGSYADVLKVKAQPTAG
ncbi:MAG: DoxX family protein [Acidobacteriota bacterium]